ncbi:Non-catalytic module family EXPN protein [Armillaria mellea]|nr:Non-catalytic module family EXPN protein [Armillaria mellea]
MFASLAIFALLATAAVQASPHFPRRGLHGFHHVVRSKPADYAEGYLEAYDVYHARYLAIGCENQHNTQFFDDCCHPLLATETVAANRPAYCAANATASATAICICVFIRQRYYSSSSSDYVPATTFSSSSVFSQPTSVFTSEASSSFSESSSSFSESSSSSFSSSSASVTQDSTSTPDATPSSTQEQNTEAQKNTQTQEAPSSSSSETAQSTGTSNASSGSSSSSSGTFYSGGVGTFYYQYGVAGSCGTVHADSDKIVAVSAIVMNSALCGKTITLTNTKNGKTVNAVIADTCPGCGDGGASIDCSTGTFDALADESDGTFPVTFTLPAV